MKSQQNKNFAELSGRSLAGAWIEIMDMAREFINTLVAPLAGAWIEIPHAHRFRIPTGSLPSRERGLKSRRRNTEQRTIPVAPLAGAWIEIIRSVIVIGKITVAPLAGAWIEIHEKILAEVWF